MKQFLSYTLVIIALMFGAFSSILPNIGADFVQKRVVEQQDNLPRLNHFCFTKTPTSLWSNDSEHASFSYSFSQLPTRVVRSSSGVYRIKNFNQVLCQKYFEVEISFLLKSSFKQLDGYYLYHLRKLLI